MKNHTLLRYEIKFTSCFTDSSLVLGLSIFDIFMMCVYKIFSKLERRNKIRLDHKNLRHIEPHLNLMSLQVLVVQTRNLIENYFNKQLFPPKSIFTYGLVNSQIFQKSGHAHLGLSK